MPAPPVRTGLDRLLTDELHLLRGRRVGLICNASSVTADLRHAADVLAARDDLQLVQLFGPEHGIRGDAQDMIAVGSDRIDRLTGLPLHSLYGARESSLWPPEELVRNLDVLVFDIQDVGARYYTYAYTMAHAMEVAGRVGIPVVVCDRPNPIGGLQVEGNVVQDGFRSFVGRYRLPNRHGLTVGELAGFFQGEEGVACTTHVVRMEGWERSMYFEDTGLPWVLPSPNMPTVDTAVVYPGGCLFEGTLFSEGRGQTRPFEIVGAPFVDGVAWAQAASSELQAAGYGGFVLRPLAFRPTFHKHVGQSCGGVQVHVRERQSFHSLMASVALLKAAWRLWPRDAKWRTLTYEFVADPIAIDLLGGSAALREEIESDVPLPAIAARFDEERATFDRLRPDYLLYAAGPRKRAPARPPASGGLEDVGDPRPDAGRQGAQPPPHLAHAVAVDPAPVAVHAPAPSRSGDNGPDAAPSAPAPKPTAGRRRRARGASRAAED